MGKAPRRSRPASRDFSSRGASRGHRGGNDAGVGPRRPQAKAKPISDNRRHGFAGGSRPYDYAAYEREPATPEYMKRLFEQHAFPVTARQLERFWRYYALLRDRNAELDLTRIMGIEATVLKHFIDSAVVANHVELRGPLLDIGSGPGFPGVPLAVMKPELPVILGESRGKRVGFLEEVCVGLGLDNARIFPRSVRTDSPLAAAAEPMGAAEAFRGIPRYLRDEAATQPWPVRDVITRALETILPTLERVAGFVPSGGQVIFMKGPQCGQEVTAAQEATKGVYKMSVDVKYDLPDSDQHRRLVVFERR